MTSVDEGMQIDASEEQKANADSPRVDKLDPFSNETLERLLASAKHDPEMVSTDEGIQID
jgi:hypothetical protein